jgi:translocation and assembly module TamB
MRFNVRRLLLIIACATVAAAIIVPAVLLWSALYTTAGLQFVVRHIPQQLGSTRLVISGVSGTVASGLHAERVEIEHHLVHLEFEGIDAHVALAPLMLQTIRVNTGSVRSALIRVKRRTRPSTGGGPVFVPRWLIISVEQAQVGGVQLTVPNGFHMAASDIHSAAIIRHRYIRFFQADGRLENAQVSAIGDLLAADPIGLNVEGRVSFTPAGQPNWTVAGSARGDLNALSIVAHTESPFRAAMSGRALDLTDRWHWVADATLHDFRPSAWGLSGVLGSITGHLAGSGDAHGFSAHGPLNPTGLRAGVFDTQFEGNYAQRVLTARRIELRHVASGARASGAGTLAVVDGGPRLEVSGSWSEFRWPLAGRDIAILSAAGSFTLSGILPYQVHLSGRGGPPWLAEMPMEVSGSLGKDNFSFDTAEIDLWGGHASLSGRLAWAPLESWSVSGRVSSINPGRLRPDLPGNVSFALGLSGNGFAAGGDLTAAFSDLSGKLRGVAASGTGTVIRAGGTWGFSRVRVALGTTRLALDGHVSDRLDLRFAVTTEDLSLLAPGTRGHLEASGTVSGAPADPAIVASAHGGDFEYQGVKLEAFDADVNFNPQAVGVDSRIDARLRKLSFRTRTLDKVVFTLSGPPAAYRAQLALSATGLTANAEARGGYTHGVFHGQLHSLTIAGTEELRLSLERPVDLTMAWDQARFEWLCLLGTPASVCADGDWTPREWSGTVMTTDLPLNTLTAGMTPAVEYLGTVSALLRLAGGAGTPLGGMLRAQLADAEVAHRLASHKIEHTRIGSGTITATAGPALISVQLALGGDSGAGTIHGELEVKRSTEDWQQMPVTGELHANTSELSLVSLYFPDIDRAAGAFDAEIRLRGTLGTPQLSGVVKVSNGEIDVYQVNLALRQMALEARLGDAGLDFTGSAHVGTGTVSAGGHLEWRNLLPYGKFHLQGANLRIADVPEAQIDASPDLDFTVTGRRIEVVGKVAIPYAKIQPRDITSAVRASADEVIVGSEAEDPAKRFEVLSTITLALGERVNLDAMGLAARLTGSVTVSSGYDAITRGTGELSVAEGQYTAYARRLDIERGRLIFTGGAIDDPGIDVRAQKKFPDVTAGVNVRGTLTQPHMSFFSDPPLPQSQIVSLILAGGSLQSAQNASNAALGQGAALLAAQLGSRVGVPDVSLETDPIANETSLVLGRYLSPRLYVSYGVSLTAQLNVFKMRYTLGDHWTVRTELGQARGADLVYTIDK